MISIICMVKAKHKEIKHCSADGGSKDKWLLDGVNFISTSVEESKEDGERKENTSTSYCL